MLFLFINIVLAVAGTFFLFLQNEVPLFIALPCVVVGSIVIYSRFRAWMSGAAQSGYALADSQPPEYRAGVKNRMMFMEILYWALGLLNVWVYLSRFV